MSYNLLKGKKGIVFGALNDKSIAWKVAERAVEEGAEIVLTNMAVSIRMWCRFYSFADGETVWSLPANLLRYGSFVNIVKLIQPTSIFLLPLPANNQKVSNYVI